MKFAMKRKKAGESRPNDSSLDGERSSPTLAERYKDLDVKELLTTHRKHKKRRKDRHVHTVRGSVTNQCDTSVLLDGPIHRGCEGRTTPSISVVPLDGISSFQDQGGGHDDITISADEGHRFSRSKSPTLAELFMDINPDQVIKEHAAKKTRRRSRKSTSAIEDVRENLSPHMSTQALIVDMQETFAANAGQGVSNQWKTQSSMVTTETEHDEDSITTTEPLPSSAVINLHNSEDQQRQQSVIRNVRIDEVCMYTR